MVEVSDITQASASEPIRHTTKRRNHGTRPLVSAALLSRGLDVHAATKAEPVADLVDGISVHPDRINWFGEWQPIPGPVGKGTAAQAEKVLAGILYQRWYSVGRPLLGAEHAAGRWFPADESLVAELEEANTGVGRRTLGWRCLSVESQEVIVQKDGLTLTAPGHLVHSAGNAPVEAGATVAVDTPAGSRNRSAGYYIAHSDSSLDYGAPLSRLYMNVQADHAARLLHATCSDLNAARLPFDLKVASNTAHYARSDVAVLYTQRHQLAPVWNVVLRVLESLGDCLRSESPMLTHPLAPGASTADDPANGQSFGTSRCRAIAAGLYRTIGCDREARLRAIHQEFQDDGIDPDRPYLSAGLPDIYCRMARR